MHNSSWREMGRVLPAYLDRAAPLRILDVGSKSVNVNFRHTYREHVAPAWTYVGCDMDAGENVDRVQAEPYRLPAEDEEFDVVISGQCLEHVGEPWTMVREMARVVRPGGLLINTAPWQWNIHRYPVDCWRILPDGWTALYEWVGLKPLAAWTVARDSWGVARRPRKQEGT